ncbi:MAG TPA: hypothetical protein VM537_29415 [Anaerolineae bacterium]|nr:hypothetical protein [Anaerolineae bacterium]
MDDQRRRELEVKFGPVQGVDTAPAEDVEAKRARLAAKFGPVEQTSGVPLRSAANPPPPEPPSFGQKALHVVKGAPAGLVFDTLNMIPSAVNAVGDVVEQGIPKAIEAAYNLFADEPIDVQVTGEGFRLPTTQDIPGVRQAEDLLASREFERGVAPGADALRVGAEWAAGGVPNLFRKSLGKFAQRALPDLVQGAGAAGGSYLGDVYADSPIIGELIGGVTGALAGRPINAPFSATAEGRAVNFAQDRMDDADAAVAKVQERVAKGETGTVADLAVNDAGAFNIERGIADLDIDARTAFDAKEAARQQQIANELRLAPDGTPKGEAQQVAQANTAARAKAIEDAKAAEMAAIDTRAATEQAQLAQTGQQSQAAADAAAAQARQAEQTATEAGLPLATGQRPAQTARAAQEAVSEWDKAYEAAEATPAWNEFKAGPDVDVKPMYEDVNAALKTLRDENPREYAALVKRYGSLLSEANAWKKGGTAAPADISGYLSDVRKAIEASRAGSPTGRGDNVDNIMKKLRDTMEGSIASDVNPLYRDAVAKTRELYQRFRSGPLGDARNAEPELFIRSAGGAADESGAVLARQVRDAAGGDPARLQVLAEQMKAIAQREGGVTDDFVNRYADALEGLPPETRQQFYDLAAANKGKESALKQADAAAKANEATQRTVGQQERALAQAIEAQKGKATTEAIGLQKTRLKNVVADYGQNPNKTIDTLLKNPEISDVQKAADLKVLTKYMDGAGQGEAFRAAVSDRLQTMLATATDASTAVKPKAIGDFEKMRDTLVNSGIITREKAADMSEALNRTLTSKERLKNLGYKVEMNRQGQEYDNLVASMLAAGVLSGMPGTQTLLVGGAVRRYIKRLIVSGKIDKPAEVAALERLMLNPEEFLAAAAKSKSPEEAAKRIITEAVGASQVTDILAGEDE